MEVDVTLSKGTIVLRAKDETYLAVRSYLVNHEANVQAKYEMQADERATHERKLLNSIGDAVTALKTEVGRIRVGDTLSDASDTFTLTFELSDRFDELKRNDLGRICEEYIYRKVVADWWTANYPDAARQYIALTEQSADVLKKCLSLKTPYESVGGVKYKCLTRRDHRVVLVYKEELMNEIHTEMLKLSRMRRNENGVADLELQTNEVEDEGLMTRHVNRHVARVCSRINAYLYELSNTVDNDMMERTPVYEFKLVMPEGWDGRLFEQLAEEIHAYLVNACLYEWLKTAIPDMAAVYRLESETAYDNIKHVVSVRKRGTIYKPLQPF